MNSISISIRDPYRIHSTAKLATQIADPTRLRRSNASLASPGASYNEHCTKSYASIKEFHEEDKPQLNLLLTTPLQLIDQDRVILFPLKLYP